MRNNARSRGDRMVGGIGPGRGSLRENRRRAVGSKAIPACERTLKLTIGG